MSLLTVNYSKSLEALKMEGYVDFDGIEIGPWFRPEEICKLRKLFTGVPFYFHAGNIVFPKRLGKSYHKQMRKYLMCTESPWISFHFELLPRHIFRLSEYAGIHLSPPETNRSISRFINAFESIKERIDLPILLENLHSIPGEKYAFAANPHILTDLIHQTDSGFLLDLAHARVAADLQGVEVHQYIEQFPIDRIRQIHVSGVREKKGHLFDAHEPMREGDYKLLEWVLGISSPEVVTLEYFREKEPLKKQLVQLRQIVHGNQVVRQ